MQNKENLALVNEFMAASFYLIGSLCSLLGASAVYGNLLFVLGSICFIMPPLIKLVSKVRIKRFKS